MNTPIVSSSLFPYTTLFRSEVAEETGAHGRSLGKLGDVRYWFNWEGERVFKVVSFFLVRYDGGRLGDIPPEHRDRKSTRLNSSHPSSSYAVFCLKKRYTHRP